ncbi:uncharacterized protein GBIM_08444, partial [Gryllus bimaculatus]
MAERNSGLTLSRKKTYLHHLLSKKLGSLSVLSAISSHADVRRALTDLGAVPLLVRILAEPSRHLQMLAARTIANVAR